MLILKLSNFFFVSLFSAYTMDVIASTGFGLEVDSQQNPDSPLVKKANKVFEKTLISSVERLASK